MSTLTSDPLASSAQTWREAGDSEPAIPAELVPPRGASRRERLSRAFTAFHARGEALLARMWSGLGSIRGVTLYGPEPGTPRTPTVAFTVAGRSTEEVARHLAHRGVYASNGDFYAATVAERLGRGADGVVRAGAACYTTADEVDRLVEGVRELV